MPQKKDNRGANSSMFKPASIPTCTRLAAYRTMINRYMYCQTTVLFHMRKVLIYSGTLG